MDNANSGKYKLKSSLNEENSPHSGALSENSTRDIASTLSRGAKNAGNAGMKGGSAADTAGDVMMMSGEPTTMAAGATLKVISGIAKKKTAERQAKANAENDRRSKLISALGQLGSGVGSTGMA